MDGMEPELFFECGMMTEPGLKNFVGSLPVVPVDSGFVDSAGLGAKIVDIERFKDEGWITFGFL